MSAYQLKRIEAYSESIEQLLGEFWDSLESANDAPCDYVANIIAKYQKENPHHNQEQLADYLKTVMDNMSL